MKKLLTLLLTLLMVFTLVGCNSKENTPVVQEPEKQEEVVEPVEDEPIVGGFVDVEDKTITDELKDIFNKALDGLTGAKYEPVELVATQAVNGINYKFLASGSKTTNLVVEGTYNIIINKSSSGEISLVDIETIEEKEYKVDPTKYDYYVVFYDQYNNELQRTIQHYGTVPSYNGYLPEGFDYWVYKKTDEVVNEFKPIITNTYFKAVCHEVEHKSEPVPTQDPIKYLAWNGSELVEKETRNYSEISNSTTTLSSGFYIVNGEVTTDQLIVKGTPSSPTYIILCDGSSLNVTSSLDNKAGINVSNDLALIITTPKDGNGVLNAKAGMNGAGIGGDTGNNGGTITINGGTITANAGFGFGSGIGRGGDSSSTATVLINGGTITTTGGNGTITNGGPGIGGTTTVNGGTTTITGGTMMPGIDGNTTINGGTITATAGDTKPAINGSITYDSNKNFIIKAGADSSGSETTYTNQKYVHIEETNSIAVTGISVSPTALSGTNGTVTVTFEPANATNKNFTVSIENPESFHYSINGNDVTFYCGGSPRNKIATITSEDGGFTATVSLNFGA